MTGIIHVVTLHWFHRAYDIKKDGRTGRVENKHTCTASHLIKPIMYLVL